MMKLLPGVLRAVAAAQTVICATRRLLPGGADRGKDVFGTQGRVVCHSIDGEGGKTAPDLGARLDARAWLMREVSR